MLSAHNILSPAHGRPIVSPTQDMVLGCYFLNAIKEGALGEGKVFSNPDEAVLAHDFGKVDLQAMVKVRMDGEMIETSRGAHHLQQGAARRFPLPEPPGGQEGDRRDHRAGGRRATTPSVIARILDQIKEIGFHYATRAGVTIGVEDIEVPPEKPKILEEAEKKIDKIEDEYAGGFLTEEERHSRVVDVWHEATDLVATRMEENFDQFNPIYMMARSGARGDLKQIKQLAGMKGLVEDPKGEIIASPITSNFRQGLTVLEYFISTHGARKGLADTALRTADSGYLTRRLVDVAQDVIVREEDCGTDRGIPVKVMVDGEINPSVLGAQLAREGEDQEGSHPRRKPGHRQGGGADGSRRRGSRRSGCARCSPAAPSTVSAPPATAATWPPARQGPDGRGGRYHRRAVHRRARHPADHEDLPLRRCLRRRRPRHHPRPAAGGRAVRGAQAQGPGVPGLEPRQGRGQEGREVPRDNPPRRGARRGGQDDIPRTTSTRYR